MKKYEGIAADTIDIRAGQSIIDARVIIIGRYLTMPTPYLKLAEVIYGYFAPRSSHIRAN